MPGRVILSQPDLSSGLPTDPAFAEAWQAEAFAMTLALHERGVFTRSEWAAALSVRLKSPLAAASGEDYYEHWLAALEDLVAAKGLGSRSELDDLAEAWDRAARATPHGTPIRLENDPGHPGVTQP